MIDFTVTIDPQDVYNTMDWKQKSKFIDDNIEDASDERVIDRAREITGDDEWVDYLTEKGYSVKKN